MQIGSNAKKNLGLAIMASFYFDAHGEHDDQENVSGRVQSLIITRRVPVAVQNILNSTGTLRNTFKTMFHEGGACWNK